MRFLGLLVVLIGFAGYSSVQERISPLTSREVEELIRARMPDAQLAVEIRRLGIEPLLTNRDVGRLRGVGAGPQTQEALERYLQPSPLIVISQPPVEGLVVTVANRSVSTNADGKATIAGLAPGSYTLVVEKPPAYPRAEYQVSLADGGSQERVTVRPAPGKLNVLVENATIEVSSRGTYSAPLRELELPAGTYSVSVKAPQHLPSSTSVTVEPGETYTLRPVLMPDLVALKSELEVLVERNDLTAFRTKATIVLDAGADELVTIKLLHHHANGFHDAMLTIRRSGLVYEPQGDCTWTAGLIPIDRLEDALVVKEGSSGVLLRIVVATGKNRISRGQLDFAVLGSSIGEETETKPMKVGAVIFGTSTTTRNRVRSPSD